MLCSRIEYYHLHSSSSWWCHFLLERRRRSIATMISFRLANADWLKRAGGVKSESSCMFFWFDWNVLLPLDVLWDPFIYNYKKWDNYCIEVLLLEQNKMNQDEINHTFRHREIHAQSLLTTPDIKWDDKYKKLNCCLCIGHRRCR
jgi:hypothetical protein